MDHGLRSRGSEGSLGTVATQAAWRARGEGNLESEGSLGSEVSLGSLWNDVNQASNRIPGSLERALEKRGEPGS